MTDWVGLESDHMRNLFFKNIKALIPILFYVIIFILLLLIPTGYEDAILYKGTDRTTAKVLSTDNSMLLSTGIIQSGEQRCELQLLGGRFKGKRSDGINMLNGSLEQDKLFSEGDKALVVISYKDEQIISINMIDHYRMDKELILVGIICVLLILFAGKTGIRALLSFGITILMIWKLLVPGYLRGINPILSGLLIALILTIVTITLVYGFNRLAATAIIGSILGTAITALLGIIFTDLYQIHGAIMPYSESLLYSGYSKLNLTQIFMASIFIGSAGAVMDLAVDITSSIHEVVQSKPTITRKEAAISGIRVGRAAIGTQTSTLLFAYSGGYLALLMVFMAQGTPIHNILNYKYVASEILETIIGSIGLVTVAPFTAVIGGILLSKNHPSASHELV